MPDAVLIAGPTASGKTRLALEMADRHNGEIINTDSMQVYPVLNVLTARPDADELAVAPHHLYAHAALDEPYSVAKWLSDVKPVFDDITARGKTPIFAGGTGLYFRALTEGLSVVPEIPAEIRDDIRSRLEEEGPEVLHDELVGLDPEGAAALKRTDSHRIARALEVVVATGKPISIFRQLPKEPVMLSGLNIDQLLILPPRPLLHERIDLRAEKMIELGAIDEVKALLAMDLPENATVLRAIGVPQLADYIYGKKSLSEAIFSLKSTTRQYAKRQYTWFRNQFSHSWKRLD